MANWNEKEIKEEIKKVIKYNENFDPKVDALYEKWFQNKKNFINSFGGKLIYELPETVCFEMNEKDKIRNAEDFITNVEYDFFHLKRIFDIIRFLEACKDSLYKNILETDYEDKDIKIQKGIKINKALKFFCDPDEKESLINLQMAVSRLIQKDKVKGKLCLSVHPLDFLSSSENTHNWRTCHALDGEYRSGNLSYMTDKSTIICYLKSEGEYQIPRFPPDLKWNSKKWRMLLHFSNDFSFVFAGREYPFSSNVAMERIHSLLTKIYPGFWSNWSNKQIKTFNVNNEDYNTSISLTFGYIAMGDRLKAIDEIVKEHPDCRNYNDILYSRYYDPYYSYRCEKPFYNNILLFYSSENTVVRIGESVPCLCCEKESIGTGDSFRCISCEEKYGTEYKQSFRTCNVCGRRTFVRYLIDADGGDKEICFDCAQKKKYKKCADCNCLILDESSMRIEDNILLCNKCYNWRKARNG